MHSEKYFHCLPGLIRGAAFGAWNKTKNNDWFSLLLHQIKSKTEHWSRVRCIWSKEHLKGLCQEDISVKGQFSAEVIT